MLNRYSFATFRWENTKNPVRHRNTRWASITKVNRFTLFREVITVYYENDMKPTNTQCR